MAELDQNLKAILDNLTTAEKQLARDWLTAALNPLCEDHRRPMFKRPTGNVQ